MDDTYHNPFFGYLFQRGFYWFDTPLNIRLEDYVEFFNLTGVNLVKNVTQANPPRGSFFTLQTLTMFGYIGLRLPFVRYNHH